MKKNKNIFEFSAITKTFDGLRRLVEGKFDAIFHAGKLTYNKEELEHLCITYKDYLTIYNDSGTSVYYFRFKKKEHYEYLPLALSLKELSETMENLTHPRAYTKEELDRIYQEGLKKLSKIR